MLHLLFFCLRTRLQLLALAVFLPAFALAFYGDYVQRDLEIHEARDNVLRAVRFAAADEERLLSSQVQLLDAIAHLNAVQLHDVTTCNQLLGGLIDQTNAIGSVVVMDLNSSLWCSFPPVPTNVSFGDHPHFQRAIQTRELAISNYETSRIDGSPVVDLALPVYNLTGKLQGVVSASINLAWLNRSIGDLQLSANSILSVIDSNNTVLVRFPNPQFWIGRQIAQPSLIQAIKAQPDGGLIESNENGESHLYGFAPLRGDARNAGFAVTIDIPTKVAYANVGQALPQNLLGLAIVTLIAMIALGWFGELMIVRRLRGVTAMVRELGTGNLHARAGQVSDTGEFSELGKPFDATVEASEQREAERTRTEQALRKWADVFQNTSVGVFMGSPEDHTLQMLNPSLARMHGYTVDELIGKPIQMLLDLDVRDEMLAWMRSLNDPSETHYTKQTTHLRKDGTTFPVLLDAAIVRDENVAVPYLIVTVLDITSLKQAEATLKQQAQELETITRVSREITLVPDLTGTLASIARLTAEIFQSDAVGVFALAPDGKLRMTSSFGLSQEKNQELLGRMVLAGQGVSGRAVSERAPVQISDVSTEPDYGFRQALVDAGFSTLAAVPMVRQDQVIGGFILFYHRPRKLSAQELSFLQAMAQQFVNAVENAQVYEAERKQLQLAEALGDSAAALNSTLDFDQILDRILDNVGRVAPYDAASIMLIEDQIGRIVRSRGFAERGLENWILDKRFPVNDIANLKLVVETQRSCLIVDTETFPGWIHFVETHWIRSALRVPIRLKGSVIGILMLDSATPNFFNETHTTQLDVFADQAAVALQNARLLAEAEQRVDQFAALYDTTRDLAGQPDLSALLETVVERAIRILKASTGDLHLYDPECGDLFPIAEVGYEPTRNIRIKLGEGLVGRVAQTRQPMVVDHDRTWEHHLPPSGQVPFAAMLQVPLIYAGELIGVLGVQELIPSTRTFTEADTRLLTLFAGQAASAVHVARLLHETRTRAEQLALLYDAGLALNSVLEPEAQLKFLFNIAIQAIHAERAEFFRLDRDHNQIHLELSIGGDEQWQNALANAVFSLEDDRGLVSWVCRNQMPLYLPDVRKDSRWVTFAPSVRSALWVPVEHHDKMLGVFCVLANRVDAFTPQDERLLVLFGNQAAVALENARLFDDTKQRSHRLALLNSIANAVSRTLSLDQLLEIIYREITQVLTADAIYIALYDLATNELDVRIQVDNGIRFPVERVPLGTGLRARVVETRKSLLISDIESEPNLPPLNLWRTLRPPRTWLGVPMKLDHSVVGIISLESYQPNVYTPQEEQLLVTIADQVAVAIQKTRLFEETQRRADRLAILNNVARAVSQSLNLDELLELVYHQLEAALKPDALTIALYDPVTEKLDFRIRVDEGVRSVPERISAKTGFSARVISSRQSLLIRDAGANEPTLTPSLWGTMKPARSWLGAPMKLGETILGILNVQSYTPHVYNDEDEQLLVTIADQVALAIQKAQLFEETHHRLLQLEAVNKVSTALRAAQNVDQMLPLLLDETLAVIGTSVGAISLYDAARNDLVQVVVRGWFAETPNRAPASDGIAGMVFQQGKPHATQNFRADSMTSELARSNIPDHWGGALVPIRTTKEIIGVLAVAVEPPHEIRPEHVRLLTTLAEIAGNAIQRARLHEQTEERLNRLNAMHVIDTAISASLDLRVVLNVLLGQVTSQLHADAADVLVLNPYDQTLSYAFGRGIQPDLTVRARLHLGEGYAGRAVLERQMLRVSNLAMVADDRRIERLASQGWVSYFAVPLVSKGQAQGVLEIFHRSRLEPDADWLAFLEILAGQAAIAIESVTLFENLQRTNLNLSLAYDATIEGWARSLDVRVETMEGHSERVIDLTMKLARALGIPDQELVSIRRGVLLHDIGKISIPEKILAKPGALSEDEWQVVRQHPQYGYDLLLPIDYLRPALDIPLCHHEKWDGSGYPRGLKGIDIPLPARIFAIVDVWDALRSPRPYRAPWTDAQAREFIQSQSGKHFDPQIVKAFFSILHDL